MCGYSESLRYPPEKACPELANSVETMTSGDVSSGADELSGQMRPLVPRWQLFAGFLGFLLLFPTAYPPRVGRLTRLLLGSSTNGASSANGLCSSKQNRQSQDQTRREMFTHH